MNESMDSPSGLTDDEMDALRSASLFKRRDGALLIADDKGLPRSLDKVLSRQFVEKYALQTHAQHAVVPGALDHVLSPDIVA